MMLKLHIKKIALHEDLLDITLPVFDTGNKTISLDLDLHLTLEDGFSYNEPVDSPHLPNLIFDVLVEGDNDVVTLQLPEGRESYWRITEGTLEDV
jgi:hypothetical protein